MIVAVDIKMEYKNVYFMIFQIMAYDQLHSCTPFLTQKNHSLHCTELSMLSLKAMVHITEELAVFDPSEQ